MKYITEFKIDQIVKIFKEFNYQYNELMNYSSSSDHLKSSILSNKLQLSKDDFNKLIHDFNNLTAKYKILKINSNNGKLFKNDVLFCNSIYFNALTLIKNCQYYSAINLYSLDRPIVVTKLCPVLLETLI